MNAYVQERRPICTFFLSDACFHKLAAFFIFSILFTSIYTCMVMMYLYRAPLMVSSPALFSFYSSLYTMHSPRNACAHRYLDPN